MFKIKIWDIFGDISAKIKIIDIGTISTKIKIKIGDTWDILMENGVHIGDKIVKINVAEIKVEIVIIVTTVLIAIVMILTTIWIEMIRISIGVEIKVEIGNGVEIGDGVGEIVGCVDVVKANEVEVVVMVVIVAIVAIVVAIVASHRIGIFVPISKTGI